MDTKSKKSRPLASWLCFFLSVSIIIGLLFAALIFSEGNWAALKAPFTDYRSSIVFKERTGNYYDQLFSMAVNLSSQDDNYVEMNKMSLDNEGENLKYYAVNKVSGILVKNINGDLEFLSDSGKMPVLPTEYKYFWYFDGQKLWVIDHGKQVDVQRLDSGYPGRYHNYSQYALTPAELADVQVLLAVRDPLVKNPYGHSQYYEEQQLLSVVGWISISLLSLGLLLLVYAMIKWPEKCQFDRKLAFYAGRIWLEVKVLLSLLVITLLGGTTYNYYPGVKNPFDGILGVTFISCVILFCFWWFYLMLCDLIINGKGFFTHNSINSLLNWYRRYEKKYSWQKSMIKRAYILVAAEGIMALISVFFLLIAACGGNGGAFFVAVMIAAAGIYLLYRYLRRYTQTIDDLGKLTDHIQLMKNGDMATRLEVAPTADMYSAASNLNSIQEGMSTAIAEKMKSERMKMELITNVSHDLKTPLTSIISYVDLLSKEEGLPEHVNDYVVILAQKSERLKNLIHDLFDLSKASSDNISLYMEQIDLTRLINQTLADMEEQITDSGLTFRTSIPDDPVIIMGDGQKLYRVWENLITNTLKYSLPGSRVFIDLSINEKGALATIKNTANYEMNFTEDEILQRFVRGDESRTTEGSGLGLAIAQSFTQISGGDFRITIDGDLFKVELSFQTI